MFAPPELTDPLGLSAAKIFGSWPCVAGTTAQTTNHKLSKPGSRNREYFTNS
jgi:hypothetical protein